MQPAPSSGAFSQFPTRTFFRNSHHATGMNISTPYGQFHGFPTPTPLRAEGQAHRGPSNARASPSTASSSSSASQSSLQKDSFESPGAQSSPSFPTMSPLTFAHFKPPHPITPSPAHPRTKESTRRSEMSPPAFEDNTATNKPPEFFGARFLDGNNGPSSARTATNLGVPANQKFVEVKPKNGYRFNVSTPATVPQKRSFKTTLERSVRREADGTAKKLRTTSIQDSGQGKKAPLKTTKIELRTNKPLKNSEDIHMDVWRIVLTYSPLKFLLDAKTINHHFCRLLAEESTVWCESRINQYSEDMPGPPGQMTEQRYAQLLEGRGCQSAGCSKMSTGKVYWAFCLRLCRDCLEKRTFKEEGVKQYILRDQAHYSLLALLRAAVIDGGKYSRCRQISSVTGNWEGTAGGALYLTSDVNAIVNEYEELLQDGKNDAEISAWRDEKMEQVKALTLQIAAIEAWDKTRGVLPTRNREKRTTYFVEQARLLNPPIREAALKKMLAYKMSLDSNTAPTQQTWEALKRKIVPYREAAEMLVSFEEQSNHIGEVGPHTPDLYEYDRLRKARATLRNHGNLVEQNHILDIGRIELARWKGLDVNDADLALRVLNSVYQSYQQRPIPTQIAETDGTCGSSLLFHL
jgi:hypothetical protein